MEASAEDNISGDMPPQQQVQVNVPNTDLHSSPRSPHQDSTGTTAKKTSLAKLAAKRRTTLHPSQVRSARWSNEEEEQSEDEHSGQEDEPQQAPDIDIGFLDEVQTPSVLAKRVLRAESNPSPPPQPPNPLLLDEDGSPHVSTEPEERGGVEAMSLSDILMGAPTWDMDPSEINTESGPDIISFRSISTPSNSPGQQHLNIPDFSQPGETSATPIRPSTVDELLSQSPSISPALVRAPEQSTESTTDISTSVAHPEAVLEAMSNDMDIVESATPSEVSNSDVEQQDVEMQLAPSTESSSTESPPPSPSPMPEMTATPVRRSARRSITPKSLKAIVPEEEEASSSRQPSPDGESNVTPKGKGKQRAVSPRPASPTRVISTGPAETNADAERVRRRKKDKAPSFNRELGSLSPNSAGLLTGLIVASKKEDMIMDTIDEGAAPSTPERPTGPLLPLVTPRFTAQRTPMRSVQRTSPSKVFTLQDPLATPARRIPMGQQERSVPRSVPFMRGSSTALHAPDFTATKPTGSPARRVLVSNPVSQSPGKRAAPSPLFPRERSVSNDPKVISSSTIPRARSASAEPAGSSKPSPSTFRSNTSKLPYSLIPSHATIPEETEHEATTTPASSNTRPAKSNLRQTTVPSRIPRSGTKPYARPGIAKVTSTLKKREPSPLADTNAHASGSGASTEPWAIKAPIAIRPKPTPSTPTLKRKREVEIAAAAARPMRQVVSSSASKPPSRIASPQKPTASIPMRKVAPRQPREVPVVPEPEPEPEPEPKATRVSPRRRSAMEESIAGPSESKVVIDMSSPIAPGTSPVKSRAPAKKDPERSSPPAEEDGGDDIGRRVTRQRKGKGTDIFGILDIRPTPRPRKAPARRGDASTYGGMTATALKSLTETNTQTNQRYLIAKLEREIIRVDSERPESPTRVRTVAQRQQEEKAKSREERAARRARASADGLAQDDEDSDDGGGDDSFGHPRGPGEEEDYQSPARPVKRIKFAAVGEGQEGEDLPEKKRVKWDRKPAKTIFVDEIEVRTKACPPTEDLPKGVLAAAAKALQLDTLGNLDAVAPMATLTSENIVVKKFLYKGEKLEEEQEEEEVEVRTTRSRSKKK